MSPSEVNERWSPFVTYPQEQWLQAKETAKTLRERNEQRHWERVERDFPALYRYLLSWHRYMLIFTLHRRLQQLEER